MATALLIVHGLVAVALLGAITHQTLATWAPASHRPGSFFSRFRAVPCARFANAVVVLYLLAASLGAVIYLFFRVEIRPALEQSGHWQLLRTLRHQGACRQHRASAAAGVLGLLAAAASR